MTELLLTDFDLHLLAEGTHYRTYEKLGAHLREVNGTAGVHFAVWAPNASRVSVVGDFNGWDASAHSLTRRADAGVWEAFIPGVKVGALYKYRVVGPDGRAFGEKADPYGFAAEIRPQTASKVVELDGYEWRDADWIAARATRDAATQPMSIYEVHLGSWRRVPEENARWLTYREMAPQLADYVESMGYTHVELLPVTEHPFDGSWGYQTIGYFAPTSRFGGPHDFMHLVDTLHQRGIGVILDWVPAHFPRDGHGLGYFDGTHLYEHASRELGFHPQWDTLIFNYGRLEVRNFLISSALFWIDRYHVDGLRVDAVASMLYRDYGRNAGEWTPNRYGGRENLEAIEFIRMLSDRVHAEYPGVPVIAEESTSWPMVTRPTQVGGLGFDCKWNMGWMHDMLEYMTFDPVYRRYHHNQITFSLMYAYSERFLLPFSHDEVVHLKKSMLGKMPGDLWQKFANLRALYGYMFGHPGKKLMFMGGEFGQWREWNHDFSLDWHLTNDAMHAGLQRWVRDLNTLYRAAPPLFERDDSPDGFEWIDCSDHEGNVVSFVRRAADAGDTLLFACNFSAVPRHEYRIGAPVHGVWTEILNSDASSYGGSGMGNLGAVETSPVPQHGRPWSLSLTLPPLAVVVFRSPRAARSPQSSEEPHVAPEVSGGPSPDAGKPAA
ncbi:MAG TPA: 1,4-alpha-glucan branching protein GlgB [Gemmatimonadaceae bacterium]|jgi:1,4-alpha-glucan branching enzyme|nr:1,4-alpha-glucan branching protein GlgB [Gemmatimonadaceae bacterium]